MNFNIFFSCVSHRGNCRNINQDNFICDGRYMESPCDEIVFPLSGYVSVKGAPVFGVFDGLGGEESGEVASLLAAQTASSITIGKNAIADVRKYCVDVNAIICNYASENEISAMGTTAALLVFTEREIGLCNIGDSKIFRFADGKMEQISVDHIAAAAHGIKPPLSQNLGIDPSEMVIAPHVARGQYHEGDLYLICSDGLTDMVSQEELRRMLAQTPYDEAAGRLLDAALQHGGKDNVTIILCKIQREKRCLFSRIFKSKNNEQGEKNDGK